MGATAPLGYRLATEPHGGGELRCAELAMGTASPPNLTAAGASLRRVCVVD